MPTLLDLLQFLDDQPAEGIIHAAQPWTATSDAAVGSLDAPVHGLAYLLEVELAQDVLEVWSSWRDGAQPSAEQKCQAVIHYAEHDAHLGVNR